MADFFFSGFDASSADPSFLGDEAFIQDDPTSYDPGFGGNYGGTIPLTDFIAGGDLGGGDIGVTGFSNFPSISGFASQAGIPMASLQPILPNLNLWETYLHNVVNGILANPSPTADDYNSAIGAVQKMMYDLLAYIDKVLDPKHNQPAKTLVQQTSNDLIARLQHDLNALNKPAAAAPSTPATAADTTTSPTTPTSQSWWILALLIILFFLLLASLPDSR